MSDATIHDRGYRVYDGRRSGVPGAVRSVMWHSMRSVLGIGRPGRHKVLPVLSAVIAYLPAVIIVGMAALLPIDTDELFEEAVPSYSDYLGFIGFAVLLFAALVAPDVLVRDRRDGMFGLYLSTPLQRGTYLVAKAAAVMATLAIVTIGPVLLYLVAFTFEGIGPDGLGDWLRVLIRIVGSGLALSAVYAAVSLAASSLTDRRAFASVGFILLLIVSGVVTGLLVEEGDYSADLHVLDLATLPFELVFRIYGEEGDLPELSDGLVYLGSAGWVAGAAAIVWLRYRRLAAR